MRGFMAGTIWGLVLVTSGAVALALLYPAVQRPDGKDLSADASRPVTDDRDSGKTHAHANATAAPRTAPDTRDRPSDPDPLAQADTEPVDRPSVGILTQGLTHPEETKPAPQVPPNGPEGASIPLDTLQVDPVRPLVTIEPSQPMAPVAPDIGPDIRSETAGTGAAGRAGTDGDSETAKAPAPVTADDAAYQPRQPRMAALPQTSGESGAMTPTVGSPVRSMTERNNKTATDDRAAVEQRPLDQYAAPFENPEDRPLLSIVLIDDESAGGAEALKDFPLPISFAIDPTTPEASEKLARYRAEGHEVLALVDLPAGATPQDAEVALAAGFDQLDQTVALLEGTRTGIRGSRELSDQTSAFLAATGRGLVTQNTGLNSVHKSASRNGVPSAVIFRDLDGAGQTPTAMRRFLDQAALRAGQEGAVIMLGRVRPDTISALLLWGNQDHSGRVVLAPVSAILRQSTD